MGHLIKNAFRWKLRNFVCIFWPLVFPLILGTFFHIALDNIGQAETMEAVPVAVVVREESWQTPIVEKYLDAVAQGENPVIKPEKMTWDQAKQALSQEEVAGIIEVKEIPALTVSQSGLKASILEMVLRMYVDHYSVVKNTALTSPEKLPQLVETMLASLEEEASFTEKVTLGGRSLNFSTQYYFALIAMASLYGGYMGLTAAMRLQANISPLGARRCITPTRKMKLVLSELLSCFVLHFCNLMILLAVLRFLYHVPLGGNPGYTVLISAFGVLVGVSFGFFIGAALKAGEGIKVGFVTCFSMVSSACAGLMAPAVKYSIQRAAPIFNWLNPAAMISDALFFVHIYDSPQRMAQCLAVLGGLSVLLITASILVTRRERYASI